MAQRQSFDKKNTNPAIEDLQNLYICDETQLVANLMNRIGFTQTDRDNIKIRAAAIVADLRSSDTKPPLMDQFLLEYGLSTEEGIILMRLAEALLRTPDISTSNLLLRDRLGAGKWKSHAGRARSGMVNLSTSGLMFSKSWITKTGGLCGPSLIAKLGDRILQTAVNAAMMIMGEHFVLGRTITEAIEKSDKLNAKGFAFSYDMLGEAAMTMDDAQRYFDAYYNAITALSESGRSYGGLSVKLSALHPRYEIAQADICVPNLIAKVKSLAIIAKNAGLGLAIDAEEVERLEISLDVIKALLNDPDLNGWDGLSIVVQAYQRRAGAVIEWLVVEARIAKRGINIRLVKGAYWDREIKRAQEMGLSSYPVFTRKENTDISYLACARALFDNADIIHPQFATHNAHTAAAILEMAPPSTSFEFQCLHGMGEGLHRKLIEDFGVSSRIYAPVGRHADLLPYLVRRLLENGANSSFVNQLFDQNVSIDEIVTDPQSRVEDNKSQIANPALPNPRGYLGPKRQAAMGLDLSQNQTLQAVPKWFANENAYAQFSDKTSTVHNIINPALSDDLIGAVQYNTPSELDEYMAKAKTSNWPQTPVQERADILRACADLLESEMVLLLPLIVREAGKSLNDAVDEVREAVDFCRYYAQQAEAPNMSNRAPIGVVACISPWNFPLAIFTGQIAANLAVGNTVIAKAAEQTPLIARYCVQIFQRAGVPQSALQLVTGAGEIGAALVANSDIGGICFTGSTEVAKKISNALAMSGRGRAPLIAETGGINAMIVDSTALMEQVVSDVVASAFQSAGQRCSACRLVCIQDDVAAEFMTMLSGAMQELIIGDPANPATDVGPVIDKDAADMLREYIGAIKTKGRVICETKPSGATKSNLFIAPIAIEFDNISDVTHEIFGPVLHVVQFEAEEFEQIVSSINDLGYGLTMGLHTRIDSRIEQVRAQAKVGNLYVNRNQIGAVVGVQPFGGEGLSGTGPKAGGPHYLYRLTQSSDVLTAKTNSDQLKNAAVWKVQNPQEVINTTPLAPVITRARHAHKNWQMADRQTIFNNAAKNITTSNATFCKMLKQAALNTAQHFAAPITLPGPTGEDNSMSLIGRGVLMCVHAAATKPVLQTMMKALSAGNSILVLMDLFETTEIQTLYKALIKSGADKDIITPITTEQLNTLIHGPLIGAHDGMSQNDIDGFLIEAEQIGAFAKVIASRLGALLPVLCAADEPYRFAHERSCTIDTTAAGGNVSLFVDLVS